MKMKKVFAILLVLAVVAGFVFAENAPSANSSETHKITVTSTVDLVVPGFNFTYVNTTTSADAATNKIAATTDGSTAEAFEANDKKNATNSYDVGQDISKGDVSATFTIYSNRVCNYNGSFDLSVAATTFKKDNTTTAATEKSVTYTADSGNHTADHIVIANYSSTATESSQATTSDPLRVTYSGRQFSSSVTLGTVTVVWNQDVNAKPDTYTSDVTLTIKAN